MINRNLVKLRDIVGPRGLIGGPFGSKLVSRDYTASGVPVVRGQNLASAKFVDFRECVYVSEEKVSRDLATNLALPGDIVFTQRGTLGQVAIMPVNGPDRAVISQSQMRLRVDPSRAVPEYVYYACVSEEFLFQVEINAIVTGVPHINLGILGDLTIPLPSLDEQRRIAEVLGALDDLIETNNRLIEKSKSLSTTLFTSMLEERIQCRLGDIADVNPTKVKPKSSGDLIYVDITSLGNGSIDWPAPISWAEAPGRARRGASVGSTLWSNVRPNRLGHALLLHAPDNLVVSTGISVLEPRDVGPAQLHEITQTEAFVAHLVARSDGSAYPAVTASVFEDAPVERLSAADSERFEAIAWPVWESVAQLEDENEQLRRTRDELLPLLMSGAVRVRPEGVAA